MSGPVSPQRVTMSYQQDSGFAVVEFDASVNEQHATSSMVTEHQVETGMNAVDHIRPMPLKLSLEVVLSNTPTYQPSTNMSGSTVSVGNAPSGPFNRVSDGYKDLDDGRKNSALWNVQTVFRSYENMAITSISVPVEASSGSAIQFRIELQEVRIVSAVIVQAPSAKHKPVNKGVKPTAEATPAQQAPTKSSFLHNVL